MALNWFFWRSPTPTQRPHIAPMRVTPTLTRSRTSRDSNQFYAGAFTMLAPASNDVSLLLRSGNPHALEQLPVDRLLEIMTDVSPDISRELWNFLRMVNPGYTLEAVRLSGSPAPRTAQAALEAMIKTLTDRHGDASVVFNRLILATFLRGNLAGELVLGNDRRRFLDIATPDPSSIQFESAVDPELGQIWRPFQWQDGKQVFLDIPTFRYIPIDPLPSRPYGRSIAAPALFPTLFAILLLHDVRRVVQQQGYPRLDLEVDLEKLVATMPDEVEGDPVKYKEWVDNTIAQVSAYYAVLEPDDAFVHTNAVKVNRPVGAVDASSLGGVTQILTVLERWSIRALKTMPLLMASPDGTSEANANRQWEIYAAGIKSIQHLVEGLLGYLLTLGLQAQGVQAIAQIRFAELRAAEMMRDAQTEAIRIANEREKYAAGWTSQDEAALAVTGHTADNPEPRTQAPIIAPTDDLEANPDPGSDR